ncbi:MAG: COG1355, Predicted dioxygenase, partial [uncultured Rubrobacteraceae bacterium]
ADRDARGHAAAFHRPRVPSDGRDTPRGRPHRSHRWGVGRDDRHRHQALYLREPANSAARKKRRRQRYRQHPEPGQAERVLGTTAGRGFDPGQRLQGVASDARGRAVPDRGLRHHPRYDRGL